jgi:hypothetical protein
MTRTTSHQSLPGSLAFLDDLLYSLAKMMIVQTTNPSYLAETAPAVGAVPCRQGFDTKGRAGTDNVLTGRHAG